MLKIAIPLANRQLCMHFGHCQEFAVVEADENAGTIGKIEYLTPPPHEPGVIPKWIAGLGVKVVITGGMGEMARRMLTDQGIQVLPGASEPSPEKLVRNFLKGELVLGDNVCGHDEQHGHNCGK